MKLNKVSAITFASLFSLSSSFAAGSDLTGRDLVEFIEADQNVGVLVNAVIKTQKLSCERPDLLKTAIDLNVRTFSIKYNCHVANNLEQKSTISLSGDLEGDDVHVGSFRYKVSIE